MLLLFPFIKNSFKFVCVCFFNNVVEEDNYDRIFSSVRENQQLPFASL